MQTRLHISIDHATEAQQHGALGLLDDVDGAPQRNRGNDGSEQASPLREGLVTRDGKTVYRIDDGIPVLLAEEGLATAQVEGFPAA